MNEVLNFVNEKTKVLLIIKDNQIQNDSTSICLLSQQEIARRVPCGKLKVNQIIKELIKYGYIEMVHAKGQYIITTKGDKLLEKMSLYENWKN